MNSLDLLACGVVWRNYGKEEAGRELIRALKDPDAQVRTLARTLLADAGERSAALLKSAVEAGELTAGEAAGCAAGQTGAASVAWDVDRFSHGCGDQPEAEINPLVQLRADTK